MTRRTIERRQKLPKISSNSMIHIIVVVVGMLLIGPCGSLAQSSTDDLVFYNDIVLYNTTNSTNSTNTTRPASRPIRRPHRRPYYQASTTYNSSSRNTPAPSPIGRASTNSSSTSTMGSTQPTITFPPFTNPPTTSKPTTSQPTITPTMAPTTAAPSISPTDRPTVTPTARPTTAAPTSLSSVSYLRMTLTSMQTMNRATIQTWQNATNSFVMDYWSKNPTSNNLTVQGLIVNTQLLHQIITSSTRRILQQGDQNTIEYQQTMTYTNIESDNANDPVELAQKIATIPFEVLTRRNQYMTQYLQGSGYSAFDNLYTVSAVSTSPPTSDGNTNNTPTTPTKSFFQQYWIWIAIGGGCVAILLIVIIAVCWKRKQRSSSSSKDFHREEYLSGGGGSSYIPTSTYSPHPQDDSTLNEPMPRVGMISSGESIAGYGDQSVTTIDYDYTRAYGGGSVGGGQSVVSSASATLGGWTNTGTMAGGNTTVAGGNTTIFSDDASYQPYGASAISNTNSSQPPAASATPTIREELIDVICPPGKLGVVIDTPNDGPPQVHAIKDSSVVADKLRVGDKLVAVDQEDVRAMTAIKVSKMISRKSANPTRVLTILRGVEVS